MNYYPHTNKDEIVLSILSSTRFKKDDFKVVKLDDETSEIVLFQIIILNKKQVYLNELLTLGLAQYNPSISVDFDTKRLLITFHITKS